MHDYLGVIIVVGALAAMLIVVRFMKGNQDKDRIRAYIEKRGGRIEKIEWAPLSRGSLSDKVDRFYQVEYIDTEGNRHRATCKTSGWTGEFFGEDIIISQGPAASNAPSDRLAELETENARLREEIEKSRSQSSQ